MLNTSVSPWPVFSEDERQAVEAVLKTGRVNYWTGNEGRAFEREFADAIGTRYAVAVANGTVALDLALKALSIGPGDEVVVTPRTFIASVSCVVNTGAVPVFADVDRDSGNITAATVEPVLSSRTKAIIAVHLAGWPTDVDALTDLAAPRGIAVIEDCAQAHGARLRGRAVGSLGTIGAWSFCQDKIMTTGGEGGMVTTNDADLWAKMWSFKDHGKSWEAVYERQHPPGFRWVHDSFGTNWRMLEVQAAIGRVQLRMLPDWTRARAEAAARYQAAVARFPQALRAPTPGPDHTHAYYRFYCYVRPEGLRSDWTRDRIVAEVNARGVPLFHGSCSEVYLEKAFAGTGWAPAQRLPVARELGETSLMFLTHPTLEPDEIDRIATMFEEVMAQAAS
mgnify:CR=1 FL=1